MQAVHHALAFCSSAKQKNEARKRDKRAKRFHQVNENKRKRWEHLSEERSIARGNKRSEAFNSGFRNRRRMAASKTGLGCRVQAFSSYNGSCPVLRRRKNDGFLIGANAALLLSSSRKEFFVIGATESQKGVSSKKKTRNIPRYSTPCIFASARDFRVVRYATAPILFPHLGQMTI